MNQLRDAGAVAALIAIYGDSITSLIDTISTINESELKIIIDTTTADEDCRSIQTILTHVIRAGNCYVLEIRKNLGEEIEFPKRIYFDTIDLYEKELKNILSITEQLFKDYTNLSLEEKQQSKKIVVAWGQTYDIEQLLEHAIVHVLRHKRQIAGFIERLRV